MAYITAEQAKENADNFNKSNPPVTIDEILNTIEELSKAGKYRASFSNLVTPEVEGMIASLGHNATRQNALLIITWE